MGLYVSTVAKVKKRAFVLEILSKVKTSIFIRNSFLLEFLHAIGSVLKRMRFSHLHSSRWRMLMKIKIRPLRKMKRLSVSGSYFPSTIEKTFLRPEISFLPYHASLDL